MTFYKNINPNYCLNDFLLIRRLNWFTIWILWPTCTTKLHSNLNKRVVGVKNDPRGLMKKYHDQTLNIFLPYGYGTLLLFYIFFFFCIWVLYFFIFIFSQQSFIANFRATFVVEKNWNKEKLFFFTTRSLHNEIIIKKERKKICLRRKGWMNYASFFYEANVVLNMGNEWEKEFFCW
jgi:hypothetical protein